jgi:hypothetical protein
MELLKFVLKYIIEFRDGILGKILSEFGPIAGIRIPTFEYFLERLTDLLGIEPNHANGSPVVEYDNQDSAIVDERDMNVVLLALVEENREFRLTDQAGDLLGGSEATGQERGQGGRIERVRETLTGDEVTVLVHQQGALGFGLLDNTHESLVYLLYLVLVKDLLFP